MRAEIISVGTELLLGDIVNTNAQFLSQELASLGFEVFYQSVVGDNHIRLRSLVQLAKERSDVLIFSGGLGPTEDDLTKETVADLYGDTLELDEQELEKLKSFFKKRGATMTENNVKQAFVPRKGHKLPNSNGTATGAFFRQGNKYAFLLPGPPSELRPMFIEQVLPVLETMQDSSIRSLTLHVIGMGESELEHKIMNLLSNSNPTAALYAKSGEVHIRITARAADAHQADIMCAEYALLFFKVLGDNIYSSNGSNLEETVVEILLNNGETIATAESCTGGLLSERITSVPGASGVFGFGATTYANDVKHELLRVRNSTLKTHGAVSSQVASEMAFGAADRGLSDYGVGITGIAGPDGGTAEKPVGLVYVAVSKAKQVFVKRLNVPDRDRDYVRWMATQNVLDMVRRLALGMEIPGARNFDQNHEADFERVGKPRRRGGWWRRGIAAFLITALLLALVMVGIYAAQEGLSSAKIGAPSKLGLQYGTSEYTAAACSLVEKESSVNPSVTGFLAMPYSAVEQLVGSSSANQLSLKNPDDQPGLNGMAILPSDAAIGKAGKNTLLLGAQGIANLHAFRDTDNLDKISTFTYFTATEAKVYRIFSMLLIDENESRQDGFSPAVSDISEYTQHLNFTLGAKMRSLYDIPIDLKPTDSYMSISAIDPKNPERRFVIMGRAMRAQEKYTASHITTSGVSLMPEAWYLEKKTQAPNQDDLWEYWMRWYLSQDMDNTVIQLEATMTKLDTIPLVYVPRPASSAPVSSEESSSDSVSGSDSNSGSGSDSGSGSVSSGSSSAVSVSSASSSGSASSSSTSDSSSITSSSTKPVKSGSESSLPPLPEGIKANPGRLTVTMNGQQITATPKDILAWVCQRECGWMGEQAIMAQAVAVHSWILNQQGTGIAAPKVAGTLPSSKVQDAVAKVADVVLSGDGKAPAFTPYFPVAANGTNTPDTVWENKRTYLKTVESLPDQNQDNWRRIVTLEKNKVAELLMQNGGVDVAEIEQPEKWVSDLKKNDGGYVKSLKLGDTTVSGSKMWLEILLENGKPLLGSPAFEVEYDGKNFIFTSFGVGHGCGMSQVGMESMANNGSSYKQILEHYYPGATFISWT